MRKLSVNELDRPNVEAYRAMPKRPLVLVLDNVRSALNVGSVFRTADAFAVERLVLCGITARPPHREILKTAIGAAESVRWTYEQNVVDAIRGLRREGYRVWAVEQTDGSVPLQAFRPPAGQPCALVFGNEVSGVSEAVLPEVDGAVEVPQFGTKHSLNVAVCVGVVIWEVVRQWSLQ